MIIDEHSIDIRNGPKSVETNFHDSNNPRRSLGKANEQSEFIHEPLQQRNHLDGQLAEPRKRGRPIGSTRQEPVRGLLGHSGLVASSSSSNNFSPSIPLSSFPSTPSTSITNCSQLNPNIIRKRAMCRPADQDSDASGPKVVKAAKAERKSNARNNFNDYGKGGNGEGIEKGERSGGEGDGGLRELGDDECNLLIDECANAAG